MPREKRQASINADARRRAQGEYGFNISSTLKDEGFNAFKADESSHNDGAHTCNAYLWHWSNKQGQLKQGAATESGAGHSEVKALCEFIRVKCNYDVSVYQGHLDKGLFIQCEAKPVCKRCATFLGLLGVKKYDENTKKSRSGMGSTEWVIPDPNLKQFIINFLRGSWRVKRQEDGEIKRSELNERRFGGLTCGAVQEIFT